MTRSPNAKRREPCMPPLLEEEKIPFSEENNSTNYSGTACENHVKAYFLSKAINIAEPHVDDGVDLLIQKPQGWVNGQVKKIVYKLKLDHGMKKRNNVEVYREVFNFPFQSGGGTKNRRQRKLHEIDYFYHVLITPYRKLIWETPSSIIPTRKDSSFIQGKDVILERDGWVRKKADIDFDQFLVYTHYDPIIFKTYPNFFVKKTTNTLTNFF